MEVMKSEFEYFQPQPIQNSVSRVFKLEVTPVSALEHGGPIEFAIPSSNLRYFDLGKTTIYVKCAITTGANAAIAAANQVGPVNLTLLSLFASVDVELNGKPVNDQNGLYPYRAYFEVLLTHAPDVQDTQLQSEQWFKDTAGQMNEFNTADGSANQGLVKRATPFRIGADVELLGRLHCDIFHQDKAILPGVSIKIRLIPTRDNWVLMSPAPAGANVQENYKIVIKDARMFVHTMEVNPALSIAHEQMLLKNNARYPIRRVTMKHLSIPVGQVACVHDNVYLGAIPDRLTIGFVSDAAMSGGYQQNPFNFENFGVNYIALYVNGELVPNKPFQPDYAHSLYIREYNSLFEGMGVQFTDKTIAIPRNDYPNGYTLYVFDLTVDQNCKHCLSPPKSGSIRLEVKFAHATVATINVVLYAEFESMIEIDKFRNVITPF